jgi:hypothetical protein
LGGGDVFFGYFPVGPRTAQVEKLDFEEANHLHFRVKTASLKYAFVTMIVFALLIVVTAVRIQLAFMRMPKIGREQC